MGCRPARLDHELGEGAALLSAAAPVVNKQRRFCVLAVTLLGISISGRELLIIGAVVVGIILIGIVLARRRPQK